MINIRQGNLQDLQQIKELAMVEWSQFKEDLTQENWEKLQTSLSDEKTYRDLMGPAECWVGENDQKQIVGFAFLVPSGNPTDIYHEHQSYIRFVTVSKKYRGQHIGQILTEKCIQRARINGEKLIALHTSEMMFAARHIYEKLGFKILRELEPRLGKKYWLYELEL
jgi:ribosomal protein S18 acetylase RimI-like enzyme